MQALPRIIGAVAVFTIGMVAANLLYKLLVRVLGLIGIDKIAEKFAEIDLIQKSNIRLQPSKILASCIYYIFVLVVMVTASDILGLAIVSEQIAKLMVYLPKLFSAGAVLLIGLFVSNMIKDGIEAACTSLGIPSGKLIAGGVFYMLFITIAISALAQAEINTTFLTSNLTLILGGVVAAFAIGYGFASRDMMSNLLGSIYSRSKFKVGDVIKIQGLKGEIIEMDSTSLTLQSADCQFIIPLSKVASENVEKFTN